MTKEELENLSAENRDCYFRDIIDQWAYDREITEEYVCNEELGIIAFAYEDGWNGLLVDMYKSFEEIFETCFEDDIKEMFFDEDEEYILNIFDEYDYEFLKAYFEKENEE